MVQLLAFSLQDQVEKYGAYIGIAAFFGLAVLSILYFAQARELRRLREWAGRAPERAAEMEARVVAQAGAGRAPAPPAPPPPPPPAGPRRGRPAAPRAGAAGGRVGRAHGRRPPPPAGGPGDAGHRARGRRRDAVG